MAAIANAEEQAGRSGEQPYTVALAFGCVLREGEAPASERVLSQVSPGILPGSHAQWEASYGRGADLGMRPGAETADAGHSYKQIAEDMESRYDTPGPSKRTIYEWVMDYSDVAIQKMEEHRRRPLANGCPTQVHSRGEDSHRAAGVPPAGRRQRVVPQGEVCRRVGRGLTPFARLNTLATIEAYPEGPPVTAKWEAPQAAGRMAEACNAFLDSLAAEQKSTATYEYMDGERLFWYYPPLNRHGLPLRDMAPHQRELAYRVVASGLTDRSYQQAKLIIDHELVLGQLEKEQGIETFVRDPELYYFTVFGEPGGKDPWAWRAEGHHVSLHFSIWGDSVMSVTPLLLRRQSRRGAERPEKRPADTGGPRRPGFRVDGQPGPRPTALGHHLRPSAAGHSDLQQL